jgi:hypothetical protein
MLVRFLSRGCRSCAWGHRGHTATRVWCGTLSP